MVRGHAAGLGEGQSGSGGIHSHRLRSLQLDAHDPHPSGRPAGAGHDHPVRRVLQLSELGGPRVQGVPGIRDGTQGRLPLSRLCATAGRGPHRIEGRMMTTVPFAAEVSMTTAAAQHHDTAAVLTPGQEAPLDLTIFISCYNEEVYIVDTIETVRA